MALFTIELDDSTSDALQKAATERGVKPEALIAAAVVHFLAEQSFEPQWADEDIAAIEEGLAQLDRGEGFTHAEVMASINARLTAPNEGQRG